MDKRVTLQSVSRASDGQGGFTESWADTATVWAAFAPASGYEKMIAGQMKSEISHNVLMRYRPGVTTKMRIAWGARTFDIKEVINVDEANRTLKLKCVEN